jgi:hypothetical protein
LQQTATQKQEKEKSRINSPRVDDEDECRREMTIKYARARCDRQGPPARPVNNSIYYLLPREEGFSGRIDKGGEDDGLTERDEEGIDSGLLEIQRIIGGIVSSIYRSRSKEKRENIFSFLFAFGFFFVIVVVDRERARGRKMRSM